MRTFDRIKLERWKIATGLGGDFNSHYIATSNDRLVARFGGETPRAEDKENAKFVVHVMNCYADTLAALKLVQFGFQNRRCVVCGGWNMGPNGETDKIHTKECPVGLAILKAES